MGNPNNLKSYKRGQSGNPKGRPRGSRNVSTVLVAMLAEVAPKCIVDASFIKTISKNIKAPTISDAIAARLVYEGVVNGHSWALREVLDRTEGKARQSLALQMDEVDTIDIGKEVMGRLVNDLSWSEDMAIEFLESRYPEVVGLLK